MHYVVCMLLLMDTFGNRAIYWSVPMSARGPTFWRRMKWVPSQNPNLDLKGNLLLWHFSLGRAFISINLVKFFGSSQYIQFYYLSVKILSYTCILTLNKGDCQYPLYVVNISFIEYIYHLSFYYSSNNHN